MHLWMCRRLDKKIEAPWDPKLRWRELRLLRTQLHCRKRIPLGSCLLLVKNTGNTVTISETSPFTYQDGQDFQGREMASLIYSTATPVLILGAVTSLSYLAEFPGLDYFFSRL